MSKRILIVDDALFMRTMLKRLLEKAGLEIAGEAENGEAAVQMYEELRPDAVLMDITMPVMDGISAVRSIMKKDSSAKIIMCTALGQQNLVIEALEAGALDYIVKPFDANRVIEGVSKAVNTGVRAA